jgi:phage terminase large subunit
MQKKNMLIDTAIQESPTIRFKKSWFNPLYFILNNIIKVPTIRTVLIFGGKSSSKTVSVAQVTAKQSIIHGDNTIAFRKQSNLIQTTLKKSYNLALTSMRIKGGFTTLEFMYRNRLKESEIVLKGLDDEEKAKGLESYKFLNLDELNQFEITEYEQFQLSLRGIFGQKVFASWNPVSELSWVKKGLIDSFKLIETVEFGTLPGPYSYVKISSDGTTVVIKTTYHDNYWIVGSPCGTYGFRDENLIAYYEGLKTRNFNAYRVNVMGEWGTIQTGNEFFKQFDETKHVGKVDYEPGVVWISLDDNVNPYVTATIWQIRGTNIVQVGEVLSKSPDNNAPKAAARVATWLKGKNHKDVVFVCGDPSASKRSTVDENSRSFYDKFIEVITKSGYHVRNKVRKSAPEVALSAAFINAIYEQNLNGWSITISDRCFASIEDYMVVKEDAEGKMLKEKVKDPETEITYEPHGHISDAKRYLVLTALADQFEKFKGKPESKLKYQTGFL